MIRFLVSRLIGAGIKDRVATPLAWAIVAIIAVLLVWAGISAYNAAVVSRYVEGEQLERTTRTLENTETASEGERRQAEIDAARAAELERIARDAENQDPEGAAGAVGPATGATVDGLRDSRRGER